ncbi:MAG: flavin reductase family protein [Candidatus Micrarchaeota archaeon]|nr:flavin reductase family protein [Candidatus Micrarchaeota archaeon]
MDLGWGNQKAGKFMTTVGLITSDGPNGKNIMSAEWTYYVSWSPALITVHIGKAMGGAGKATLENIRTTKEFGVNIAAEDQIAVLEEMGAEFYNAKSIKPLMLKGAALNAECRLKEIVELGDHSMAIGEVLEIESHEDQKPLFYSLGKYYRVGEQIHKPEQAVLDKIKARTDEHKKKK